LQQKYKAYINLFLVTLIWGSTFPLHKAVLTDEYTFPYLFGQIFYSWNIFIYNLEKAIV